MGGSSKKSSVTVGYHYYMNVHLTLGAAGIQEIEEIKIGDRTAWKGSLLGASSAIVSQLNLFGGEKREGGVCGVVDFMPGGDTQPLNPSISNALMEAVGSPETPAYRGVSSVFMKGFDGVDMNGTPWVDLNPGTLPADGNQYNAYTNMSQVLDNLWRATRHNFSFYWSAMNPYFKVPWFKVRRNFDGWYPEKASINGNSNPAHIYYEVLTNTSWGMGEPSSQLDSNSFTAAADTFYEEGLGLSFLWDAQQSYADLIGYLNDHCNSNLVEDRVTGKWRLVLVREDYNVENVFELNESNCKVTNISGKTLSETVNEVVVSYTNTDDGTQTTVTAQDLANFINQGRVNSQKRDYPGVTDPSVASRLAFRDLATLSKPLKKVTVEADRSVFDKYPGDVVKLVWPREGINGLVFRIGKMNLGDIEQGVITLELVEDVFGLPSNVYTSVATSGWVNTTKSPEPVLTLKPYELSYYELYTTTTESERLSWPENVSFSAVVAEAPNSDCSGFSLFDSVTEESVDEGLFAPTFELNEDIDKVSTVASINISPFDDIYTLAKGGLAWLNDELVEITGYNLSTNTVTMRRGCIDTIPMVHSTGSKIFLHRGIDAGIDLTPRVAFEQVDYKLLTETSNGVLQVGQAPTESFTLAGNLDKPYPPGNVKVNNELLSETMLDGFNLTWAHRDRTQQLAGIPGFTDGDIGPEVGVEYELKIYDENDILVENGTFPGNSFVYDEENETSTLSQAVPGYSGVFSDSKEVYDPLSSIWVDSEFKPIGAEGATVFFQGEAKDLSGSSQPYPVIFTMLASDTSLDFTDTNRKDIEGEHHIIANGLVVSGINGWFSSLSTTLAPSAGRSSWNTDNTNRTTMESGSTSIRYDGTQFYTFRYEEPLIIYTSTNGYNFSSFTPDMTGINYLATDAACYTGGKYFFGGEGEYRGVDENGDRRYTTPVIVSDDLVTFTELNFPDAFEAHRRLNTPLSPTGDNAGYVRDIVEFSGGIVVNFSKVVEGGSDVNKLYHTVDEGLNWTDVTPTGNHEWRNLKVMSGKLYLFRDGEVAVTTDLSSWSTHSFTSLGDPEDYKLEFREIVVAGTWLFMRLVQSYLIDVNGNQATRYKYKVYKTQDCISYTLLDEINANVLIGDSALTYRLNSKLRYELCSTSESGQSIQKHNNTVERLGYGYNYGKGYGGK